MIDSPRLLTDLQREVTRLHADLRARCDAEPPADAPLKAAYDAARAGQRTALTYKAWREEEFTNVAVAWVLACVFIRFLEDNALVETLHLAGPDAAGLGRARDQQIVFFREHPGLSKREYLEHAFAEIGRLPGIEGRLRAGQKTCLALHPGLLARYGHMNLIGGLAADVGRDGGPRGLWVLTPDNGQFALPTLNGAPIPITNKAQHTRLTSAWLRNEHRGNNRLVGTTTAPRLP